MANKKAKKVVKKKVAKKPAKVPEIVEDVVCKNRERIIALEQRIDKIVDAISRAKKVKGL